MVQLPKRPIQRCDARDLAHEVVYAIAVHGPIALYIDSGGSVYVSLGNTQGMHDFDLVGLYDAGAEAGDITDDILAMQRERIDGKAENDA